MQKHAFGRPRDPSRPAARSPSGRAEAFSLSASSESMVATAAPLAEGAGDELVVGVPPSCRPTSQRASASRARRESTSASAGEPPLETALCDPSPRAARARRAPTRARPARSAPTFIRRYYSACQDVGCSMTATRKLLSKATFLLAVLRSPAIRLERPTGRGLSQSGATSRRSSCLSRRGRSPRPRPAS